MHTKLIQGIFGDDVRLRDQDMLTEDHPRRSGQRGERVRLNIALRAVVFLAILAAGMTIISVLGVLAASVAEPTFIDDLLAGDTSTLASNRVVVVISVIGELFAAVMAYLVVVMFMERRRVPYELAPGRMGGLLRGGAMGSFSLALCVLVLALLGSYRIISVDTSYNPWLDLLTLGLTAGIAEEIIMRGIVLRLLEEWLGSWVAIAISAALFGFMHLGNQDGTLWGATAIAIEAGLLFGAIYIVTRSLWWCIGLHMMWNITQGPVFGSVVSGTGEQQSWLVSRWSGPEILTGGQFGLEASIVPVILLGAVACALLVYAHSRRLIVKPSWRRHVLPK
ncbi:CPBP family intramembrane glutamic endopeptidase [Bifidobacterium crudilactis]|uniref:CPBP family intramembrane glutamic endopeptidase n=1 Tax=Bifidobacterium crudilactis TaxID=327277 RepID=UPI00235784F5|nr:CPBP family intramembrane glutamic endopeptidase [Bifidobacterium crudilactis]MCI1217983.1 CPBP family intramembrane metalloprotease [Bifidobacterium crudilactis]